VRIAAYLLVLMAGLGGLEPPTSPLSVLRSLVSESHSSRYRMRSGSTIQSDALARVAAARGLGASKEQQALVCLGTQAERPQFQDGILEGMLEHSRNPGPESSTHDLPHDYAQRAPNRPHPRVSRRRPCPLRNPPREGSTRIMLEDSRRL
jgi:hypothetical protein